MNTWISIVTNGLLALITGYYVYLTRHILSEMVRTRQKMDHEERTAVAASVAGWVADAAPHGNNRARLQITMRNGSRQAVFLRKVDLFEASSGLLMEDALPTQVLGPGKDSTHDVEVRTKADTGRNFEIAFEFREGVRLWKRETDGRLKEKTEVEA